jgi:hypothetical protein
VPLLDTFWAILMIALFFAWLMLLFRVFADLLRSTDIGGWTKAIWALFVIIMPLLGVLLYVFARGRGMTERQLADDHRAARGSDTGMVDMRKAGGEVYINTQGM